MRQAHTLLNGSGNGKGGDSGIGADRAGCRICDKGCGRHGDTSGDSCKFAGRFIVSIVGIQNKRCAVQRCSQVGQARRESISDNNSGCGIGSGITGVLIGTHSKPELADMVFAGIYEATKEYGVYLAAQCCEHLNRALILEKDAARKYGYPMVNVVPQPKAGGSFATAAYKNFKHPVAVEHIKAAAGMDIGDTLIGMHLQDVAVPTRIETKQIGNAHVVCARTRLKFIGGERAVYDHDLM